MNNDVASFDPALAPWLGSILLGYLALVMGIAWWARGKIHNNEDFLVAGRRLPLMLAWPTLLATWFGAGTLLTATDEVRQGGLRMAALDPLGAGLCLLLAGAWLAKPLWKLKLLTLSDFFRHRFGRRAELFSGWLMIPTYFGWIAAQFVALAGLLELLFGIHATFGIALVAIFGCTYTLLGGMWSVTLTDALQMLLIAIGLVVLSVQVLDLLGDTPSDALAFLFNALEPKKRILIPHENSGEFLGWLGVLTIGALGNLPGQDLTQRVFASRSAKTAQWACYLAGITYLLLGCLPIFLGLSADVLLPYHTEQSTIGVLASLFLHPVNACLLLLAIISAVLSTIDSAILSPSSVLAQNLLPPRNSDKQSALQRNRVAVVGVSLAATITAYLGEDAYSLLESAYALGLVSLLVPLLGGIVSKHGSESVALYAMLVGTGIWLLHQIAGWSNFLPLLFPNLALPVALSCALLAAMVYATLAVKEKHKVNAA